MLFDEFDAIGRSRDDATEHGEIKRVVNSFLQIMDGFDGRCIIIAATNFEQALDPAIWRRFDEVVRFERPNTKEIAALVVKRLAPLNYKQAQVQTLSLALNGGTFADAERVCFDIRKACVLRGERVLPDFEIDTATKRHAYRLNVLEKAHGHEYPAVDQD
jgi:SpoVK/Ycf46/Vps4 family AAA+-type ATPase